MTLSQNGAPAVDVRDLRVDFISRQARVQALRGASLTATAGEITTILGTNGAGKSTLLKVLQGLQRPTSGTAQLLGTPVTESSPELRARVGVMLQETGLPPAARPLEFLGHIARFYRRPLPVATLARDLGIDEFSGTPIRRLSGGQKQRVALAAAVVGRPELVMLDEPSAGLDPVSRVMVTEFIESLRDSGTSIVLTTHLLDDAERLSDYVHILSRGVVRQSGTLDELTSAAHGKTLTITARPSDLPSIQDLRAQAERAGLTADLDESPRRVRLSLQGVITPDLLRAASLCAGPGETPLSLSLTQANLTDIFFQTTREDS